MDAFAEAFEQFLQGIGPNARLRLAPTPSGLLHLGNALNFWLNYRAAQSAHADLLLRIDDMDADRKRPEYVQDVFDSLHWLGIHWTQGPRDAADFEQNWSQHLRIPLYHKALDALRQQGLLFACRKSRRDLAPWGGAYPAEFREQGLSLDAPDVAWRIRTPEQFPLPDFVVRRRDGLPAYQVASVVDDLHFGITHVIRGADLADSTTAQRWLAQCMAQPAFAQIQFLHHPLLLDAAGEKLSKSAGASALRSRRLAGERAEMLHEYPMFNKEFPMSK
jgi:glutamyl-tRNA synthetase